MLTPVSDWPRRITRLLVEYEWSQGRLAMRITCDKGTVNRWLRGKCVPSPVYRERLTELERRKGIGDGDHPSNE